MFKILPATTTDPRPAIFQSGNGFTNNDDVPRQTTKYQVPFHFFPTHAVYLTAAKRAGNIRKIS